MQHYLCFPDDVDWAKQNLNTADLPAVFAPGAARWGDMALMEQCRGFVLSNSTYSWWAQYLAKATDKLVLAPKKWYAHTKKRAVSAGLAADRDRLKRRSHAPVFHHRACL